MAGVSVANSVHSICCAFTQGQRANDKQFQLLEGLKNLKRLGRGYLTPEELRLVTQAYNFLEERLRARVI